MASTPRTRGQDCPGHTVAGRMAGANPGRVPVSFGCRTRRRHQREPAATRTRTALGAVDRRHHPPAARPTPYRAMAVVQARRRGPDPWSTHQRPGGSPASTAAPMVNVTPDQRGSGGRAAPRSGRELLGYRARPATPRPPRTAGSWSAACATSLHRPGRRTPPAPAASTMKPHLGRRLRRPAGCLRSALGQPRPARARQRG